MSLEINNIRPDVPKVFVRGQTLEFIMDLPPTIPFNWFGNGATISTVLAAELRQLEHAGDGGLIANLNPTWEPGSNYTKIHFLVPETDGWPIGPAEFDVKFIRTITQPAVAATGVIEFFGMGETVVITLNGVEINIGTTVGWTLSQLATIVAAQINVLAANTEMTAEPVGPTIALTAAAPGAAGNALTISTDDVLIGLSGPTLSGGSDAAIQSTKKYRSDPTKIFIADGVTE